MLPMHVMWQHERVQLELLELKNSNKKPAEGRGLCLPMKTQERFPYDRSSSIDDQPNDT
jgi:hypothetical protein